MDGTFYRNLHQELLQHHQPHEVITPPLEVELGPLEWTDFVEKDTSDGSFLGGGGYGEVWKAKWKLPPTGRKLPMLALKQVRVLERDKLKSAERVLPMVSLCFDISRGYRQ
jgi:hypothetical protein